MAPMDRNLRLVPVHQSLTRALAWMPVFVLFTRARFDLDGALLLASLYYLFVVAMEVPSGWMSDRVGRVPTLRLAAVSWIGAHSCFALGDDRFIVIALGQFLLAAGFACLSGTDVTFHFDTLEALDRAGEFSHRQARVSALGYTVTAIGTLTGGMVALADVRWAFVVSLLLAIGQFGVTLRLTEPPARGRADTMLRQVRTCLGYARDRLVGWILFYGVLAVTLEHVAFTLMQPWLTEVLDRTADDLGGTPLLAGGLYASVAVVGAAAARASAPLDRRFGAVATLIVLSCISSAIVTAMALSTSAVILAFALFRSAQGAAGPVIITSAVAPRVEQRHRATLLSLDSLVGRLGYGVVLLVVSAQTTDDVGRVLAMLSGLAWTLVAVLVITALWWLGPPQAASPPPQGQRG